MSILSRKDKMTACAIFVNQTHLSGNRPSKMATTTDIDMYLEKIIEFYTDLISQVDRTITVKFNLDNNCDCLGRSMYNEINKIYQ